MKILVRVLLVVAVTVSATGVSSALEPIHYGKYGNPEEPAARPYKAIWRGFKRLFHGNGQHAQMAKAADQKSPGEPQEPKQSEHPVGTLTHTIYMGMAGSYTPPVKPSEHEVTITVTTQPHSGPDTPEAPEVKSSSITPNTKLNNQAPPDMAQPAPVQEKETDNAYTGDMIKKARKGHIAPKPKAVRGTYVVVQ